MGLGKYNHGLPPLFLNFLDPPQPSVMIRVMVRLNCRLGLLNGLLRFFIYFCRRIDPGVDSDLIFTCSKPKIVLNYFLQKPKDLRVRPVSLLISKPILLLRLLCVRDENTESTTNQYLLNEPERRLRASYIYYEYKYSR